MITPSKQQEKFISLLRELFQLNQPDLDFGLYRIMHAKSAQIEKFLSEDLFAIIQKNFAGDAAQKALLAKVAYETELQNARDYGVSEPENSPKVQQALATYHAALSSQGEDAEIYDHLYRFFERYYDNGDFLSRRYYARETSEKAAPYAVPYDGSEVYLHWANKDQYYIKSSEYFSQFTFDLAQAQDDNQQLWKETTSRKAHFKLVDAEEGEHNNVKASAEKDRYFIVDTEQPLEWVTNSDGEHELVVRFHYRADSERTGQAAKWRVTRNAKNEETILNAIRQHALDGEVAVAQAYFAELSTQVSKGSDGKQTLLAKYLNQYTAKNSMDYFIHKDLGGFLRRELDFYIKNEMLRLDDLGTAEHPQSGNYDAFLKKLLTLRNIAHKLIDFLAQTEEFQKKLWLKKKFVVDTQWLVTLDKVPTVLYPQIKVNQAQWAEWVKLGFIGEDTDRDALIVTDSKLVLDTQFFDGDFTAQLLASIPNLDEATDGVLVHSENFQALNLLQERYREQVKCIYIDPPYNTGDDGFVYKDSYPHSSWLTMFSDRIKAALVLQKNDGWSAVSINEKEHHRMLFSLEEHLGEQNLVSTITIKMSHLSGMKMAHVDKKPPKIKEYLPLMSRMAGSSLNPVYEPASWDDVFDRYNSIVIRLNSNDSCENWTRVTLRQYALKKGVNVNDETAYDAFRLKNADIIFRTAVNDSETFRSSPRDNNFHEVYTPTGLKKYVYNQEEVLFAIDKLKSVDGVLQPVKIKGDIWEDIGINNLHNEGGVQLPNGKKPVKLVERIFRMFCSNQDWVIDYFAGSGTTGHAVMNLNREDSGNRKYILVEMGGHFDTVLKPRIAKVVFSKDWTDGKPTSLNTGISQLVKVIRLESYEDALNNLQLSNNTDLKAAIDANPAMRESYFLHYLLELETQGSPSLLNVSQFSDPTGYTLNIKKPGSDGQAQRTIDLVETFNWLIGLRVSKLYASQTFDAELKREMDASLPAETATRLVIQGKLKLSPGGAWWFRSIEGLLANKQRILVVWRKLTGDLEQDNTVLEAFLREVHGLDFNQPDSVQFDVIYVNGSTTIESLPHCEIRLLESEFHRLMWAQQDA